MFLSLFCAALCCSIEQFGRGKVAAPAYVKFFGNFFLFFTLLDCCTGYFGDVVYVVYTGQ